MVEKKRYSKNRGNNHRKKIAEKKRKAFDRKNNPGPKGTRYFFSYSENMIGRAIIDSGIDRINTREANLTNHLIDIWLPDSQRDKNARYGVLYATESTLKNMINIINTKEEILIEKLGKSQEDPEETRLTILKETKNMETAYSFWVSEKTNNFAGLLALNWKMRCNDLGSFLYEYLHPLVGIVYRELKSSSFVSENTQIFGYNETNSVEGVSKLRDSPAVFFGKGAKNKSPHKITVYSKEDFTKLQNLSNYLK